jgi:hypothetical protein
MCQKENVSKYLCLWFIIEREKATAYKKMHEFTQIKVVKYLEESEGSVWIISQPIIRHVT